MRSRKEYQVKQFELRGVRKYRSINIRGVFNEKYRICNIVSAIMF